MNPKIKASLHGVIHQWLQSHVETPELESLNVVYGRHTTEFMADAAAAVFDAMCEAQAHALREGILEAPAA